MFDAVGIPVPTSREDSAERLGCVPRARPKTPFSANAGEFGLLQMWWQFVSGHRRRPRESIDDYMFLRDDVDFIGRRVRRSTPAAAGLDRRRLLT